jgi:hypothetical protein
VDTRDKIVDATEAARLADAGAVVVSGYFDPLTAAQAQRLSELKRDSAPLMVLITSPEHPILPVRARAELVASLRVVDHVAESAPGVVPRIRLEQEHASGFQALVRHVHERQAASS